MNQSTLADKSLKKIVLIEDDPVVSAVYQSKLERDGYNVITAVDGQVGFYLVHETKPDAIILDLMLPKMDGLQILKKLRAQKQFETLPVFVFTNEFANELTREARNAGATEVFDKNKATPEDFLRALGKAFFPEAFKAIPKTPVVPAVLETNAFAQPFPGKHEATFLANAAGTINRLRDTLVRLIRSKDPMQRITTFNELLQTTHLISGNAAAVSQKQIARSAAALEAYIHELLGKPDEVNSSAVRTICQTVDFLCLLLKEAKESPSADETGLVLIVDDDSLCRRAAKVAMDRAQLKSIALSDPEIALQVLTQNPFDLIILDVQMPVMDGFTLCQKLRELPAHKVTPVIFVTSQTDFETRTKSTASGGNEFIAKPYLFMELALKALISLKKKADTAKN
ncbi:MAG: hypothetical protein JWM68_5352 [Verrucomicrobiales bacterium]|nr:hypothetical protein [Verrucomicrobiales bacterium]